MYIDVHSFDEDNIILLKSMPSRFSLNVTVS